MGSRAVRALVFGLFATRIVGIIVGWRRLGWNLLGWDVVVAGRLAIVA